jgi:DNA (cytosine-5)-methyltransferase 1
MGGAVSRPRLVDLFCGAGGCARGYQQAGFEVVGVDVKPQPNYPFVFGCADALSILEDLVRGVPIVFGTHGAIDLSMVDAIHASPPCQAHSSIAKQQRTRRPGTYEHPDLVEDTRRLLRATGLPYVIENVLSAPLENAVMLCGSSFGLDVRRHRLFESNVPILALPCAHHWQTPRFRSLDQRRHNTRTTVPVHGGSQLASVVGVHGHLNYAGEQELRQKAMGIDWMTPYELTQAIPPAFTEHIGGYLLAEVQRRSLGRAA